MNKSGKSVKIFVAVLAAVVLFGIGGVLAAIHENSGKTGEITQTATVLETTGGESAAGTAVSETSSFAATSAATSKPAEQKTTTAAQTNSYGYYYKYPGVNPAPAEINPDQWFLLLVNIHYYLPKDYAVNPVKVVDGSNQQLDARAAPHFIEMYNAAKTATPDELTLTPISGYRSISTQAVLFDKKIKEYTDKGYNINTAVMNAAKSRQPPGCSEHNAGLAMDLCQIDVAFAQTATFRWLLNNAVNYGFILRYPENKQSVTGVKFEPWHWRYVGVEAARAMQASGQCLEEYLNKVS